MPAVVVVERADRIVGRAADMPVLTGEPGPRLVFVRNKQLELRELCGSLPNRLINTGPFKFPSRLSCIDCARSGIVSASGPSAANFAITLVRGVPPAARYSVYSTPRRTKLSLRDRL